MAYIQDGSSIAGNLAIETAAKAARSILYNAAGQPVTRKHNAARDEANDEGFVMAGYNDGNYRHFRADRAGGIAMALNTSLLTESFEGGNLPSSRWSAFNTTMLASQSAAAGLLFNSGAITTASTGYMLKSLRPFQKPQRAPLHFKARARFGHVVNSVIELGLGDAASFNGANSNGAYWQVTSGGAVQPVLTYNGVDMTGAAVAGLNPANFYTWDLLIDDDKVLFMVQDTSTGLTVAERVIRMPVTQAKLFAATRLFALARLYTTASAPASAPQLVLSTIDVVQLDVVTNKPWAHQLVGQGMGLEMNPVTFASTVNWTNSAATTSATLSNTTAGYSTMGGRFQFAAITGAETDYALFAVQAPSPYSMVITGVEIDTFNMGAAVAGTSTNLEWWLGYDQPAVNLATSSFFRFGIGGQDFAIGDPIGKRAARLDVDFKDAPRVTNPGRFTTIIVKMPVATATPSQIIRGIVNMRGHWE
jgi:hypothetical protein